MNKFNWQNYLENYPDLVLSGIKTKEDAWNHYQKYGRREKRTDIPGVNINTTKGNLGGRFGNVLFYNFVVNYLAKISNLKVTYKQQTETEEVLKIKLFDTGTHIFGSNFNLTDQIIDTVFKNNEMVKNKNLIIAGYFQTPTVARVIKQTIEPNKILNECVFVHVRLGDIIGSFNNEPYDYYENALNKINPKVKGYITSDSIDHQICKSLMGNFNLVPFNENEVDTIKFGSSCKWLVLSKGTFSWWMGVLSSGEVYYPDSKKVWHGNIFVFPEWKKITF
jgi:hypothetical protein